MLQDKCLTHFYPSPTQNLYLFIKVACLHSIAPNGCLVALLQWRGTVLCWAAISGHTGVVELLIERGANVEAKDKVRKNPACAQGHTLIP